MFKPENRINALVGGISYGTQVFPYFGVGIFIPIVVKSLNVSNPDMIASAYNLLVLAGAVIGVILFDKMPRRAFLLWTFYIAAAGIIGIILLHTISVALTIICFLIFAMGMAVAVVSENCSRPACVLPESGFPSSVAVLPQQLVLLCCRFSWNQQAYM